MKKLSSSLIIIFVLAIAYLGVAYAMRDAGPGWCKLSFGTYDQISVHQDGPSGLPGDGAVIFDSKCSAGFFNR
ncbi:hypothetical protein IPJ72_00420 [Candidatus Peregrinibacteria bacterium]|nr:MAG: hypothetical protein IPJ72_00420 [Candidatus Peregrinibacteria bacterium]